MIGLKKNSNGSWSARKRLPDDVRGEYGRLYGQRLEAKFSAPADTKSHAAKQLFNEWSAEVESRIGAIRARRKGEGTTLTKQQARALAGEWYEWFIARHPLRDLEVWEALRERVHGALKEAVGDAEWERSDPDERWREDPHLRRTMRPVLADVGETAQFLDVKQLVLNGEGQERFLDWLYEDLAAALHRCPSSDNLRQMAA